MFGRVGRTPCEQLRGLLISQQRILEGMESSQPRSEVEIAKVKAAIQDSEDKLLARGC
jgi:hypothetical protein